MATATQPKACGFDADNEDHQDSLRAALDEIDESLMRLQADTGCAHQFLIDFIENCLDDLRASEGGLG